MPRSNAPLLRLLQYSRAHRRQIIWASCCSILNKLFDIAPEVLIGVAVDVVVNRDKSFLGRFGLTNIMTQIWVLGLVTFFIWVCESLFEYLYQIGWRNLAQTLQHELRVDAFAHILKLDMSYFEDRTTGGLVSILNDDINQLERFLDGGANSLWQVATALVAIGGIFFYLAPGVALFAIIPIPMILIGAFYFQKRATPLYAEVRERVGLLGARLSSSISGIATIKSFTAENYELTHLQAESNEYVAANRRAIAVSSAFNPLIRLAVMVGFISALVFGGYLTVRGSLQVGSYSILIFLTQRLLWPLTGLAQTVDLFERAMASTSRVLNLIETPVRILSTTTDESQAAVRGEIRLEQVSFAYANHIPILRDVSLSIAAGETVAFVGATGSGKSTLAKLLLRFYEPQQGRITLDGRDLEKWNLAELRRNIGFVSQDVFLFQGTIRDNIRYGSFQASDDEVIRCAQQAEADEFIRALPAGYDTRVGERGVKLSGGQRQRLSIARALLKNPPILIFDEATSSVDNETEAAIQRSLDQISVGRTTLMIAHRLSTISKASSIFVLDRGQVVQHGRHRDLVNQPGIYANLWRVQAGLNAPLASESHV